MEEDMSFDPNIERKQPTQKDWDKWYEHKSNKERFLEAQEASEEEE